MSGWSRRDMAVGAAIFLSACVYAWSTYSPLDDAHIFLVYARNILAGNGPTFNGVRVEGFTSPAWVAILSIIGLTGLDLPIAASVASVASAGAALLATAHLARTVGISPSWALVPAALLAACGDVAFYMSNGMEHVLFAGAVAWSTAACLAPDAKPIRVGLILAAMAAVRPEGALIAAVLLLAWALRERSIKQPFVCGLVFTAVMAALVGLRLWYYGWPLPNTFYAKSGAGFSNVRLGVGYLHLNVGRYGVLVPCVVAAMIAARKHLTPQILTLFAVSTVWLAYVALNGGDNMVGGRVLLPLLPGVFVLLVACSAILPETTRAVGVATLAGVLLFSYASDSALRIHRRTHARHVVKWAEIGRHLKEKMPPEAVIAVGAAGALPYYSELPAIDMLGLNDEHIAHYGDRDPTLGFGHQLGDGSYVLDSAPDLILVGKKPTGGLVSARQIREDPRFPVLYRGRRFGRAYLHVLIGGVADNDEFFADN